MTAESFLKSPKSEISFINLLLTADNLQITIGPYKQSGKLCIRGIRLTVSHMLEYLAAMKLLFEHNLSHRLAPELASLYSGSVDVCDFGLSMHQLDSLSQAV